MCTFTEMFKDLLVYGSSHVVHHRETADGLKKMIIRPGNGEEEHFNNANPLTAAVLTFLKVWHWQTTL